LLERHDLDLILRAKQTQLPGEARWDEVPGAGDGGQNAPNKPNFRRSKKKGKCFEEKELWSFVPTRGLGKTNPIPGGVEHLSLGPPARGGCTNKANPGCAGRDEDRRVVGGGSNAPNKPNFERSRKKGKGLAGKELW